MKKKLSYEERFAQSLRAWSIATSSLMALGAGAIALVLLSGHYDKVSAWLLTLLALVAGAGVGFIGSWLMTRLIWWIAPIEAVADRMRLAIFSIAILALLISCLHWKDVPTNAQIDAVHNDPRFAAAIAEINDPNGNRELFIAAMKNGHAHVNRYFIFAAETLVLFFGLAFLFSVYGIIYRILLHFWGPKAPSSNKPVD